MSKKTLSILGDSISTFQDYIPDQYAVFYPREGYDVKQVDQTWWKLVMDQSGLELFTNNSYSGSRVSETGIRPLWSAFISERRQKCLGGDIIIVFGGTNDFGQMEFPTTLPIFRAAYGKLVSGMLERHASSSLYFCTPIQRTDRKPDKPNIHGWTQLDMAQTIRDCVSQHGKAHLIDLASYPITEGDGLLQDGLHPTIKGMQMIGDRVMDSLKL